MMMRDGGKGDVRRPLVVTEERFNNNWDVIFKNKNLVEEAPYNPGYEDASFAPGSFRDVDTPKPALWINTDTLLNGNGGDTFWDTEVSWWPKDGFSPLYAQPVKELTDAEIRTIQDMCHLKNVGYNNFIMRFARAILRKAQEK